MGREGEVMSCSRMENKILGYVDGRLRENERLEVEKHLAGCAACCLRVNEFRAVSGLLEVARHVLSCLNFQMACCAPASAA